MRLLGSPYNFFLENADEMPLHKNVVFHYANVEFFLARDINQEDCIGWMTLMFNNDQTLRPLLESNELDLEKRKEIARGIMVGLHFLGSKGKVSGYFTSIYIHLLICSFI